MDCYREPCLYYFATAEMDDDTRTRIDRILEKMQEKFPAGGSHGFFGSAVKFVKMPMICILGLVSFCL